MKLGEKLLQARQEAGFSQRQLCEGIITRNMLSQIEHGAANPSMDTLRALAARLGKPLSWFLEEDAAHSPNLLRMRAAEDAYRAEEYGEVLRLLEGYQSPDPLFDRQKAFLQAHAAFREAEHAATLGKTMYAKQLLESAQFHAFPELERSRLLLLSRLPGCDKTGIAARLPSLDEELLLRAEAALLIHQPEQALACLKILDHPDVFPALLLKGKAQMALKAYSAAADTLKQAERENSALCAPLLEICFRELGDFQSAYFYACQQKK